MSNLSELGLWGLFIGSLLASTVVPFSSDALYIGALAAIKQPWECLLVATFGNWIGSLITYSMGWIGRWEWLEKWFKVKPETLSKQKVYVDKYGIWLALMVWVPFAGDVFVLALGFYKTHPFWTAVLMLVSKFIRTVGWTLILGYPLW